MVENSKPRSTKQCSATERWLSKPGVRAAQNEKARLRAARNRAKKKQVLNEQASHRSVRESSATPSSRLSINRPTESPGGLDDTAELFAPCSSDGMAEPFDFCDLHLESSAMLSSRLSMDRSTDSPGGSDDTAELFAPGSSDGTVEPFDFRDLCLAVSDWQFDWGAENVWGKCFYERLCVAQQDGQEGVDRFLYKCEKHARKGRALLQRLKSIKPRPSKCTTDDIRDLFLQGYELIVAVTSEVKFFEVKIDEYAPAVPMTRLSRVRHC